VTPKVTSETCFECGRGIRVMRDMGMPERNYRCLDCRENAEVTVAKAIRTLRHALSYNILYRADRNEETNNAALRIEYGIFMRLDEELCESESGAAQRVWELGASNSEIVIVPREVQS
jgi:hypothetical protein